MEWYTRSNNEDQSKTLRAFHRFFLLIRHPADVWLVFRIGAWSLVLPALKRLVPLKNLAPWMWMTPKGVRVPETGEKIAAVVRWISIFLYRNDKSCLERSLLLYRFLSGTSNNPMLISGLKRTEDQQSWKGHAWVVVDGKPFDETVDSVEDFKTLLIYGTGGACTYPSPARDR